MRNFARRHSVFFYFVLTFSISWIGALIVAAPALIHGEAPSKQGGILLFPVMIVGPCISGMLLTYLVDGPSAIRRLLSGMYPKRLSVLWVLAIAIPPCLIWSVLFLMSGLVSAHFAPNLFWIGAMFGIPAGFIEEIGWTGFALPHMTKRRKIFAPAVLLGLLWGLWHLPAVDYLGAATPHGSYLLPFFLAFTAALAGLRVLISWLYANTRSLLLAQLVHISSTGALVVFSPPRVTAGGEAFWYLGYAAALWAVIGVILLATDGNSWVLRSEIASA